jgi:hypothetical protein
LFWKVCQAANDGQIPEGCTMQNLSLFHHHVVGGQQTDARKSKCS